MKARRSPLCSLARAATMALLLLAGSTTTQAIAQPQPQPSAEPAPAEANPRDPRRLLSPAVREALDAPFLTPAEAKALRLRHGVPEAGDFAAGDAATWADAQLVRARAALAVLSGNWTDPSLTDARADPLDRAEALVHLGRSAEALELLAIQDAPLAPDAPNAPAGPGPRQARLEYEAARLTPGLSPQRRGETLARAQAVASSLRQGALTEPVRAKASALVEAVALAAQLTRDLGTQQVPGMDHEALMGHLATARTLDPLLWSVPALEGELLLEKDNYAQARTALSEASKLNPAAAKVWLTGGLMAVASFDFPSAEQMARRLDQAAALTGDIASEPPASTLGAVVRARALMRQDGPEAALGLIDAQLAGAPDAPLLLATRAAALAGTYDFPALDLALDAFERRFNAAPLAAFAAGQTLADLRQYERAASVLSRAGALAPHWAQPVVELGLLEVQTGRNDRALAALTRAFELDPFNVRADNSLRLIRALANFGTLESKHFVVRAKGPLDLAIAREMLPVLEEIHTRVALDGPGQLNHTSAQRTVIELMPDHASFAVRIAGLPRLHTIAASTGPVIAMEAPRDGKGHSGPYDWERVLQHEYVHTVGLSRTSNRMPHWFTEAQAVYLERRERDYSTVQLLAQAFDRGELFDLDEISIAFTRPKEPTDRALAYAQGHWMYQFMSESFGQQAPLGLMDRFAKGQRLAEAFQAQLDVTPEQFMARFATWAQAQLEAWGMRRPAGQPSAQELLGEPLADGGPDPDRLASALAAHPTHADILEVALRRASEADASATPASQGRLTDTTIDLARRYAAARPADPLPHRLLARHYLDLDPAQAITHLRWLDAREEREPTYAAKIAAMLAQPGVAGANLGEAWRSALRAVRISPYSGQLRELAATIALQRKDYAAARGHLEILALLEPQSERHPARLAALARLESAAPAKPQ